MKHCVDCKFYEDKSFLGVQCFHEKAKEIDMVYGVGQSAYSMRQSEDKCYRDAKWFEPKEVKE